MAKHNRQAAEKAARNAAYADRFPRRSRRDRKDARGARVAQTERRWLVAHGIEIEKPRGLGDVLRPKKRGRRMSAGGAPSRA